jgi:DNA-binding HxlR family transcriptional regulator
MVSLPFRILIALRNLPKKHRINLSLEVFGDKWSLLILRDRIPDHDQQASYELDESPP